jgi:adenylate kinase family enzyme
MATPNDKRADRPGAVLLVGPTASGKSPLGDLLEARGLWGERCVHFDFGANLRACAAGEGGAGLAPEDCALVARLLAEGALLKDEHFPIAERLLRGFLEARGVDDETLVVLNGLPRHEGQARAVEPLLVVEAVVHLACAGPACRARVAADTGGDRAGRPDDAEEDVRRKLAIYRERTAPLLDHYRGRGTPVLEVPVEAETTAETMRAWLERAGPPGRNGREGEGDARAG